MSRSQVSRGLATAALALIFARLGALAPTAAAQGTATVNLNTWLCPDGYDQHSDCEKIGGVSVQVTADGEVVGGITSMPDEPGTFDVPAGSTVTLAIAGGQPEGTTLEPASLTFTAVEGSNPATLVVVEPVVSEPVDTDGDGISDAEEVSLGTDQTSADTDGDGFADGEEVDLGSDPRDPASFPQGTEPNEFRVQVFNCPEGHEGKVTTDLCADPATGVAFTASIPGSEFAVTNETDASGGVTFGDFGSGTYVVREDLDDLGFTVSRYTAMCVGNNAPGVPEARQVSYTDLGDGGYQFELTQGEVITCTWFNAPAAGTGSSVPAEAPTRAPIARLPVTGSGHGDGRETAAPALPLLAGALALAGLAMGVGVKRRRT